MDYNKGGDIMKDFIISGQLHKKHKGDAGMDVIADKGCTIKAGGSKVVSTDLRINVPLGYAGLIHSRSGLAFNHGITAFLGVIDANYTGEVKVLLYNNSDKDYKVKKGDKIAQLLVIPVRLDMIKAEDEEAVRGENGFGSTGK